MKFLENFQNTCQTTDDNSNRCVTRTNSVEPHDQYGYLVSALCSKRPDETQCNSTPNCQWTGNNCKDKDLLHTNSDLSFLKGNMGAQGVKGDAGEMGPSGPIGDIGEPGKQGEKGEVGGIGLPGATGKRGEKGKRGQFGTRGEIGEKGDSCDDVVESFKNLQNMNNNKVINRILKALLFGCLFYILNHKDSHRMITNIVKKQKYENMLIITSAIFCVSYYILNIFI